MIKEHHIQKQLSSSQKGLISKLGYLTNWTPLY